VHGPARGVRIEECPLAQFLESVPDLLPRVHDALFAETALIKTLETLMRK
jgi:hypothetical protein